MSWLLYLTEPVVEMWDMETWLTAFSSPGAGSGEGGAGDELAVVPDGASGADVGYGDLANSLLQSRGGLWRGWSRGRVLLYLMEPVVEMWDMETWLTAFSSPVACSG
jgi:hypothetical protein